MYSATHLFRLGVGIVCTFVLAAGTPAGGALFRLDVGGALDGLFLGDGWEPQEGPYTQYGEIWRSRCRWARQGATVRLPVFPGVANRLSMRAGIGDSQNQRLRLFLDDKLIAEFSVNSGLVYETTVEPALVNNSGWAKLKIETEEVSPRDPGDSRDLRAAVDWIEIAADAPARDPVREILDRKGVLTGLEPDSPPALWRFRYDPNNHGNTYAVLKWDEVDYDDSGFRLVPTSYVHPMRRGDAAWYRAWLIIDRDPDGVAAALTLPGGGVEDVIRDVWVNGVRMEGPDLESSARQALITGPNLITVKLKKGPFPEVTGDDLIDQPVFSGRWSEGRVFLSVDKLNPRPGVAEVTARLISPAGQAVSEVVPGQEIELTEYGEHSLVVEDDRGRRQVFPVHHLGIHFFHWGWYSAAAGTEWKGFTPASNDYIDQLFARLDEWGVPHHSISWGGAIFAPGTGFHATKGADYPGQFRKAIESGRLGFVGMPFPPRNICTDFGESLSRSMRRSLSIYESVLGCRPTYFSSHDSTFTPLLPQIMRLCGYDAYCITDNWWGQKSIPNSRDCLWTCLDGSTIRVLDSWYHGISVTEAVRRAVEQGKPAVFCAEEFACLDATGFLDEAEWKQLAGRGIFLKPVILDEYRRITEGFASQLMHRDEAGLAFKGWTGGSAGETEFEKANRILESNLVSLENLVAMARWLGIPVDQAPIDEAWDLSMRWHECHLHFSNGEPTITQRFRELAEWCRAEMRRLGSRIAERFHRGGGVTVFNPLGFELSGPVRLELPEGTTALEETAGERRSFPVQPDPDAPGMFLASLQDLPSTGCRGFRTKSEPESFKGGARVHLENGCAVLENENVRVRVGADGEVVSLEETRSGKTLISGANRLYFARRHDLAPQEPLSRVGYPLNLHHYLRPAEAAEPRVACSGPVLAEVECDLVVSDYPGLRIKLRVILASGERQVRLRLTLSFDTPAAVCPRDAVDQHEGTYLPGIFAAFSAPADSKPVADMAYCLTDGVLASTNHETFLNIPFRNGTFNALSLAGPDTGSYTVLTRGLHDFFVVRDPEPFLALSFGMGTPGFPYSGEYVHEYALFAEAPGPAAFRAAQAFMVEPFAVDGAVAEDVCLIGSSSPNTLVTGVEYGTDGLLVRLVNLVAESVSTRLDGVLDPSGAELRPEAQVLDGRTLTLPPRSIREIRILLPAD